MVPASGAWGVSWCRLSRNRSQLRPLPHIAKLGPSKTRELSAVNRSGVPHRPNTRVPLSPESVGSARRPELDEPFSALGGPLEPGRGLRLYSEIGFRRKSIEVIDALTTTRHYRVAIGTSSLLAQGHMGTPQEQQPERETLRVFAANSWARTARSKLSKGCQKVFESHGM
jgi:hypothetical protein